MRCPICQSKKTRLSDGDWSCVKCGHEWPSIAQADSNAIKERLREHKAETKPQGPHADKVLVECFGGPEDGLVIELDLGDIRQGELMNDGQFAISFQNHVWQATETCGAKYLRLFHRGILKELKK